MSRVPAVDGSFLSSVLNTRRFTIQSQNGWSVEKHLGNRLLTPPSSIFKLGADIRAMGDANILIVDSSATYRHLQVNGVIVSHAIDHVRHKGYIYAESTDVLGKPDKVYPCKDFDIYFYEDGSGGFRYLAEQMKRLKR